MSGEPTKDATAAKNLSMSSYRSLNKCTWCDSCGNYGIWTATKRALLELGLEPWQVLLCFDIGCHGNMSDKMQGYRFHGLHGRVIPFAAGAKCANSKVPVIAYGGDGASFSEGIGHLVHAIRSNYPITFIMHNNANYGLTTGQASSLTPKNKAMNSSPYGIPERTLPSMDLVFSLEPTFVARGFSGNIKQLTHILKQAIEHQPYGFAYVDVLQACPTFNYFATHEYLLEHTYDVSELGHDTSNFEKARVLATDTSEKIATGVLYANRSVPNFLDSLASREGVLTEPVDEATGKDVRGLLNRWR